MTSFLECGEKYRLQYIERLRPKKTKSSLLFGNALDKAFNCLLENKPLKEAYKVFAQEWNYQKINNVKECLRTTENVKYTKTDLDIDLVMFPGSDERYNTWKSLYTKGMLMLKAYNDKAIPKITKVIAIQKEVRLYNSNGDYIKGFIDLIAEIDGKLWICDNKTSSYKYPYNSAELSPQLNIYHFIETKDNKLEIHGVCHIVALKNVKKNKTKVCKECGHTGTGTNYKTCNNILSKKRCDGEWTVKLYPEVDIDFIFNTINPEVRDKTLQEFDDANNKIVEGEFEKNTDNCFGKYGKCDFFELCHHKNRKNYVKV